MECNLSNAKKRKTQQIKNEMHAALLHWEQAIIHRSLYLKAKLLINIFAMERLRKRAMRMTITIKNMWVLHHDIAISINEFLLSKNISVASQPPYSLDFNNMAFPLPKIKKYLKGRHFGTLENPALYDFPKKLLRRR